MLSAGIAALRRAERCKALSYLPPRLASPAVVTVHWHSNTASASHEVDRPVADHAALRESPESPPDHKLGSALKGVQQAEEPSKGNRQDEDLLDSPHGHAVHQAELQTSDDETQALQDRIRELERQISELRIKAEAAARKKRFTTFRTFQPAQDPLTEILLAAQQAEIEQRERANYEVPEGVFERVAVEPRRDPFDAPQSKTEAGKDTPADARAATQQAEQTGSFSPDETIPELPRRRTATEQGSHEDGNDAFSELLLAAQEVEKATLQAFEKVPEDVFEKPESPQHPTEPAPPNPNKDFRDEQPQFPILEVPDDPEQRKALPTGFDDMTFEEQQEELWIVTAEGRYGHEWELPDPGKHRPYNQDYPAYSPPKVLGMLHRWRSRAWTPHEWRLARAIAGNRSLRLPVLATQAWLRRHALLARRRGVELKIERYLGTTEEWKSRLSELERQTGITEADIKQWLWILYPVSGDAKLQRFLKSNCRKPLFLLTMLLAKDKIIQEPATFVEVLKYVRENYVFADRPQDELNHPAYKYQGRSMTWWHYLVFLYRLVWHCREGWPAAMPLLSRLTAEYIGTMRLNGGGRAMTAYQARSLVLNKALQYFSWPARVRPLDHMEHNWAAQRHLLRLAASADPPLVMDQNGYRAIRKVLVALSKTRSEAKNADRATKTWPPYRRTLDGIDERRLPEDDLSRSAKAGILVREAGYEDEIVDRALSALGGSTFGASPTIQTRSLAPVFFSGTRSSQNIYHEWAAQVKATRNAREAWMLFENPPEPGIRPTIQVYAEMFEKLFARPVGDSPAIRPGDSKEVFPVYDGNLSEFEIARLTPPTPDELYDMMLLQDKIAPSGHCLAVLVRNAPSKMAALRYLNDSPYEPYIKALKEPLSWEDGLSLKALARLPLPVFNAWIAMLCRLHTRRPRSESIVHEVLENINKLDAGGSAGADIAATAGSSPVQGHGSSRDISHGGSIPEAIALATAFQLNNPKYAREDAQPWHTIMGALAGTKILYSQHGAAFNIQKTLSTFLDIYRRTTDSKGIDPVSFEALCLMIRKTLRLSTFEERDGRVVPRDRIGAKSEIEKLVMTAHRLALKAFRQLVAPVPVQAEKDASGEGGGDAGQELAEIPRYNVVGRPLYRYMMALGCCGDAREMVRVMDWVLDGWDHAYVREEAKAPHDIKYHYMMRMFGYFVEVGGELVEPNEMERLAERLEELRRTRECTWFWPTASRWSQGTGTRTADVSEADTDRVILERWPRLRDMILFADPSLSSADSLEDLTGDMPMAKLKRPQVSETDWSDPRPVEL
ncbi:hypothetical protein VTK26DRAFT_7595 [Humicola hyalothermophila]